MGHEKYRERVSARPELDSGVTSKDGEDLDISFSVDGIEQQMAIVFLFFRKDNFQ